MKIKQINDDEVLKILCDGCPVYRFNSETGTSTDLSVKSVNTIKKDLDDKKFLYFTVTE